MTAVKKPDGRRAVFDATFGEQSLNNSTPTETYLNQPTCYDFPKIEDFKRFILECGEGCFIWKRDLSRYYLQLPTDPIEYPLLCFVWRSAMFFFCALMFGLRHAGLYGQRVTIVHSCHLGTPASESDHRSARNVQKLKLL